MAVPATDNVGGERGTPPGGATGSIPTTLPATDGRSQSANGGTSVRRADRSSQPEKRAPPNGAMSFVMQAFSGRSGALRRPVGAPAQPRLSGSPVTRRDLSKVPGHATNLRGHGGSAGCQRADRADLRRAGPAGRDHRAAPPVAGHRHPPLPQAPARAGVRGRGHGAGGDDHRRDPATRRHPRRSEPRRRPGRRVSGQPDHGAVADRGAAARRRGNACRSRGVGCSLAPRRRHLGRKAHRRRQARRGRERRHAGRHEAGLEARRPRRVHRHDHQRPLGSVRRTRPQRQGPGAPPTPTR